MSYKEQQEFKEESLERLDKAYKENLKEYYILEEEWYETAECALSVIDVQGLTDESEEVFGRLINKLCIIEWLFKAYKKTTAALAESCNGPLETHKEFMDMLYELGPDGITAHYKNLRLGELNED